MAENHDLLKCPLCEGHGEVLRSNLISTLTDVELQSKIDAYLATVIRPSDRRDLTTTPVGNEARNFQTEVHSWNPQLPMWRRSAKE